MILYFSGTGNSQYVAETIKKVTGNKVSSINAFLKSNKKEELNSKEHFIFVCPTYAWQIPRVVESFIKKTNFSGTKDVYFLLTCGGESGNAVSYIKKLCIEKDFNLKGCADIKMPDNYIAMYDVPSEEKANTMLDNANKVIAPIAEDIRDGKTFNKEKSNLGDKIKSSAVNSLFYSIFVKDKGFYSTDACISCKKCSKLCPLNNIEIINGKPKWNGSCTHCMACISGCPTKAIEYKNKTQGKRRYYNNRINS